MAAAASISSSMTWREIELVEGCGIRRKREGPVLDDIGLAGADEPEHLHIRHDVGRAGAIGEPHLVPGDRYFNRSTG